MNRSVDWKGTITTWSGVRLDLVDPRPEMITLADIARGLSRVCRWSGQCDVFYSVAQHSVLVASLVTRPHRLQALLHDATEAYIGDMPRPLKDLCPDYRLVEERLWRAIAMKFGLPTRLSDEVKHADDVLLVTERRDLMTNAPDWGWENAPEPLASGEIDPLSEHAAYSLWLDQVKAIDGLTV